MTPSNPTSPDQREVPTDSRSRHGGDGARGPLWLAPVAVCLSLVVLTLFHGTDAVAQLHPAMPSLLIAVLAFAACACPARFAIAASLIVVVLWSWMETRTPNGLDGLPGQLIRLIVVTGLVAWLARLKGQLADAQRSARVDSLTGLPNRQALIEALNAELGRAKRFGRPFTLALLDCDGFKQINDLRGHLAGDEVLRRIGESLRRQTRPYDCAGRWGGDEFLIVLSEVDHHEAPLIAERLRAALRHNVERDHPSLTFSLGVVTLRNADLNWQECVRKADEAMYAAKRVGRGRTRFEICQPANAPVVHKD